MKIYLASRYSRLAEVQAAKADLEIAGHVVTARWVKGNHDVKDDELTTELSKRFAIEDFLDLAEADWVISFTESPRCGPTRGGRHVEFGIALALSKRLIVVGHRENVFHAMPAVEFYPTWAQAYAAVA